LRITRKLPHNLMNRCLRDPYGQWGERRTGGYLVVSRLLDCRLLFSSN
jgi:hypothetical protein